MTVFVGRLAPAARGSAAISVPYTRRGLSGFAATVCEDLQEIRTYSDVCTARCTRERREARAQPSWLDMPTQMVFFICYMQGCSSRRAATSVGLNCTKCICARLASPNWQLFPGNAKPFRLPHRDGTTSALSRTEQNRRPLQQRLYQYLPSLRNSM